MIYMNLCRRVYIYTHTYIYILCDDIYNLHYVQYDVGIYICIHLFIDVKREHIKLAKDDRTIF